MRALSRPLRAAVRRVVPRRVIVDELASRRVHRFTLYVSGLDPLSAHHVAALYGMGCTDAVFGSENGEVYAYFARRAATLKGAVESAAIAVEAAVAGARVGRLRLEESTLPEGANPLDRVVRTTVDVAAMPRRRQLASFTNTLNAALTSRADLNAVRNEDERQVLEQVLHVKLRTVA
jgi:hypothetical protein